MLGLMLIDKSAVGFKTHLGVEVSGIWHFSVSALRLMKKELSFDPSCQSGFDIVLCSY